MRTQLLAGITLAALALPSLAFQAPSDQGATTAPATFPGSTERLPADLVALIPADASGLIYVAPLDTIEEAVQDLLEIIAPDMVALADVDSMLLELAPTGFDVDLIDRSRPMAFAMGAITPAIQEQAPQFYMMVPSTNPAELSDALGLPAELGWTRISGGYLGISPEAVYPLPGKASGLPARLPKGLIAASIDAEPIVATFGPMVKMMAGMARSGAVAGIQSEPEFPAALRPMANDAVNALLDNAMGMLDSLTGLDAALNLEGARFEAGYALTFREGGPMERFSNAEGAHFADLAHLLDPAADMTVAMGMDLGGLARWARPYVNEILDAIPMPDQADGDLGPFQSPRQAMDVVRESLDHGMEALTWFGDGLAMSSFVTDEKNRTAVWMHNVQADNLSASLQALFRAELASLVGLSLTETRLGENTTELSLSLDAGVLATNFDLGLDEAEEVRNGFEQMFGEAMRLSLTPVGDNTLVFFNGDAAAIKSALTVAAYRPGTQDPAIGRMVAELGDAHPFSAYRINLGPVAAQFMGLAESMDSNNELPQGLIETVRGLELPLTMHDGMTSTRWFQGASLDLSRAGAAIGMLIELEASERELSEAR